MLCGGITSRLVRHELLPLDGVAVRRKCDGGSLDSPERLSEEVASGAVCIYYVKPPTVDIYYATDCYIVNCVRPWLYLSIVVAGREIVDDKRWGWRKKWAGERDGD